MWKVLKITNTSEVSEKGPALLIQWMAEVYSEGSESHMKSSRELCFPPCCKIRVAQLAW